MDTPIQDDTPSNIPPEIPASPYTTRSVTKNSNTIPGEFFYLLRTLPVHFKLENAGEISSKMHDSIEEGSQGFL